MNVLPKGRPFQADRISHYLVTGVDCKGKRFRVQTANYYHMRGINVWRGSKWAVDVHGKRQLLWRIYN